MRNAIVSLALLAPMTLTGCSPLGTNAAPTPSDPVDVLVGGDRPAIVQIPEHALDPAPLLVMLHGYGSNSGQLEDWLHLGEAANERGWVVIIPDGTTDQAGDQFWNAGTTDCCNMFGSEVDDSAYLDGLIDEVADVAPIDPQRVFVFGHSNGGFMAHRMACDHADRLAAVISFAGITIPEDICNPTAPVNLLQVHGTLDAVVPFEGGNGRPPAAQMVADWAAYNGCDPVAETSAPPFDLTPLDGDDATVTAYTQGCGSGGSATLWAIGGGTHQPAVSPATAELLLDYLEAHPKPSA